MPPINRNRPERRWYRVRENGTDFFFTGRSETYRASTVGRFVSKLLVFFMVRLYTACLSPAEYSAADPIVDMANLLIPLASLGVSEGIFRNAANRNRNKEAYHGGTCRAGCRKSGFPAPVATVDLHPPVYGYGMAGSCCMSCLANLHAVVSQYLFAVGRVRLFAGQGVLNTVLIIVLNILFLPVLKLGVTGYVMSTFIADGLTTLLLILYTRLWRSVRRMSLRELGQQPSPCCASAFRWFRRLCAGGSPACPTAI